MDLTNKRIIKELLLKYNVRPSKHLGQNFLTDKSVLRKIIETAELSPKDIILEIGPGIGNLTQELAKKAKKVIAIEKDKRMVETLKETMKDYKNVEIIQNDALKSNYSLPTTNYKLIANLPYYITSPIIRKFLESKNQPEMMVLMVQKEVAQRICSKPPKMSLLAVSVQFYAIAKIVSYVKKECFWPSPKVDSAIIKINPHINRGGKKINTDLFFKIIKAGFSQPRKQLINNLSKALKKNKEEISMWLLKNNINPEQRAETLNISDWERLTNDYLP